MPPRAPRILYHPIKAMSHPHKVGNSARQTLNSQSRSDIRHHQQPPSTETADEAAKSRRKGKQRADPLLIQQSHGKEREIEGSDSSVPALIDEAIHTSISRRLSHQALNHHLTEPVLHPYLNPLGFTTLPLYGHGTLVYFPSLQDLRCQQQA